MTQPSAPINLSDRRATRRVRAGSAVNQFPPETRDERAERIANRLDPVQRRTPIERALSVLAWFGTPAFSITAVVVAFLCGYGTCHFFH